MSLSLSFSQIFLQTFSLRILTILQCSHLNHSPNQGKGVSLKNNLCRKARLHNRCSLYKIELCQKCLLFLSPLPPLLYILILFYSKKTSTSLLSKKKNQKKFIFICLCLFSTHFMIKVSFSNKKNCFTISLNSFFSIVYWPGRSFRQIDIHNPPSYKSDKNQKRTSSKIWKKVPEHSQKNKAHKTARP